MDDIRDCICADPENCTQPVPGYRCRRGAATRAPSTEERGEPSAITDLPTANGVIDYLRGYVRELQEKLKEAQSSTAVDSETIRESVNRLNSLANYDKPLSKPLKAEIIAVADLLAPLVTRSAREVPSDPFNCPGCGAHDFGLNRPSCPHCGFTVV